MAKKAQRGPSDPILAVLEQVKDRLNTTNALLQSLGARAPAAEAAGEGPPQPRLGGRALPRNRRSSGGGRGRKHPARVARPPGLEMPMERLIALRNERYAASRPRYWGIVTSICTRPSRVSSSST